MSVTLNEQLARLVKYLTLICGLVTACLAFYAGTLQSNRLAEPLFASTEVTLVYAVLFGAGLLYRHPQMSRLGGTLLLLGISFLSFAGVEIYARRVSRGFPDPNSAAHMAIYIYPAFLMGGALLTVVASMLVSGNQVCPPDRDAESASDEAGKQ